MHVLDTVDWPVMSCSNGYCMKFQPQKALSQSTIYLFHFLCVFDVSSSDVLT